MESSRSSRIASEWRPICTTLHVFENGVGNVLKRHINIRDTLFDLAMRSINLLGKLRGYAYISRIHFTDQRFRALRVVGSDSVRLEIKTVCGSLERSDLIPRRSSRRVFRFLHNARSNDPL